MNSVGRKSGGNRWKNVEPWDRILAKVEKNYHTGCWEWIGARNRNGYGMVYFHGRRRQAYHVTWELHHQRALPAGKEIDHLCSNPRCVNPLHLEPVTHRENLLRGNTTAARRSRQTHCKRGHEFTPQNTYISKRNERVCRKCRADRQFAKAHGLDFESYVLSNLDAIGDHMREAVGDLA